MTLQQYSREYIYSVRAKYLEKKSTDLDDFIHFYQQIINENTQDKVYKYDIVASRKKNKRKDKSEKVSKTIKIILNKLTDINYPILIETLICEISKSNSAQTLVHLADEIINKFILDTSYQDLYIKLCNRIWNMKHWHENLFTITTNTDNKLFWSKNGETELHGPYNNEKLLKIDALKLVNFKTYLLDHLQNKFNNKNEYIAKSNGVDDDELRTKYRRQVFGIIEFIGKLYNKKYISQNIIHIVIYQLIINNPIPDEDIESFIILWKIIDSTHLAPMKETYIEQYFNYLQNINNTSQRILFMIQDLIAKKNNKYINNTQPIYNTNNDTIDDILYNYTKTNQCDIVIKKLQKFPKNELIEIIVYTALDSKMELMSHLINTQKNLFTLNDIHKYINYIEKNFDEFVVDIPNLQQQLNILKNNINQH